VRERAAIRDSTRSGNRIAVDGNRIVTDDNRIAPDDSRIVADGNRIATGSNRIAVVGSIVHSGRAAAEVRPVSERTLFAARRSAQSRLPGTPRSACSIDRGIGAASPK
jgi:hypothetical protein